MAVQVQTWSQMLISQPLPWNIIVCFIPRTAISADSEGSNGEILLFLKHFETFALKAI